MPFQKTSTNKVPSLNATFHEYVDLKTGAVHVHLENASAEMCFLVGFPTPPTSENGVAHILEHTTLCGSEKYPVRDPFFSMLKRSTSTYMNAVTYPDRTMFPFATLDSVDFHNLLDIYLDAAFFPKLDYNDFLQEGWRYEFEEGQLSYQGIVLNEIKEASSDPVFTAIRAINSLLMSGTPYEYDAGGTPAGIPSLSHAELVAFHHEHYAPSQAVFMSSGPVDVNALHSLIDGKVLIKTDALRGRVMPGFAKPWEGARSATVSVPYYEESGNRYGYVVAWRLGASRDNYSATCARLLEAGLIGDSSAPVSRAIEAAGFGYPSQVNGLSTEMKEMCLFIGMENLESDQIESAKAEIWKALIVASEEGVPVRRLKTLLRDIRFEQRNHEPTDMPVGLELLSEALPYVLEGAPAASAFNYEDILDRLDREIEDPGFFKSLVKRLVSNQNRVDAVVVGDIDYLERQEAAEQQRLRNFSEALTAAGTNRIKSESRLLQEAQRSAPSKEVLPRIRPSDIPSTPPARRAAPAAMNGVTVAAIATPGIARAAINYDISSVPPSFWPWISLYTMLAPQLGVGPMDFGDASGWRDALATKFHLDLRAAQPLDPDAQLQVSIAFAGEGLEEDSHDLAELLIRSVREGRLDEVDRVCYLTSMAINEELASVAAHGDAYIETFAAAPFSPLMHFNELTSGVRSLPFLKHLDTELKSADGRRRVVSSLMTVRDLIFASKATVVVVGVPSATAILSALLSPMVSEGAVAEIGPREGVAKVCFANHLLHAPAQVNHCEQVWPAPKIGSAFAGATDVLANLLTNEILHRLVREEGGAYHVEAQYDYINGFFRMVSGSDPKVEETFSSFNAAVEWIVSAPISLETLEEAIICAVKDLDRPLTEFKEVSLVLANEWIGLNELTRSEFRRQVLQCTIEDVRAAAVKVLQGKPSSKAAFIGKKVQVGSMIKLDLLAKKLVID